MLMVSHCPPICRNTRRWAATGNRTAAAIPTRANTTTVGSSTCTAILMNRYGMPQNTEIAPNSSQPLRVIVPPEMRHTPPRDILYDAYDAHWNSAQIGKWSETCSASVPVTTSQATKRLAKEGEAKI